MCYLYLIAWSSNIVQLQGQSISNHNVQLWKESLDFGNFVGQILDSGHFEQTWKNQKQAGAELCQAQLPTGILLNFD